MLMAVKLPAATDLVTVIYDDIVKYNHLSTAWSFCSCHAGVPAARYSGTHLFIPGLHQLRSQILMEHSARSSRRSSSVVMQHKRTQGAAGFKEIWRALHSEGWTSKPPPGRGCLDNRYRYIRPGGSTHGEEGVDFFLGEENLVQYYVASNGNNATTNCFSTARVNCAVEDADMSVVKNATDDNLHILKPSDGARGRHVTCDVDEEDRLSSLESRHFTVNTDQQDPSSSRDTRSTVQCAVCHLECTTERSCTGCGASMHHFCSHDICVSLGLRDDNGNIVEDFGESCYCSAKCYLNTTATPANQATKVQVSDHENCCVDTSRNTTTMATSRSTTLEVVVHSTREVAKTSKYNTKSVQAAPLDVNKTTSTKKTAVLKNKKNATLQREVSTVSSKRRKTTKSTEAKRAGTTTKRTTARADAACALKNELIRRARLAADKYVNASVCFSPTEEPWMPSKFYRAVGAAFLVGIITRYQIVEGKNGEGVAVPTPLFKIQWTNTAFQTKDHVHNVAEDVVDRGVRQYVRMNQGQASFAESWTSLCNMIPKYSNIPALTDEFEELDESEYRQLIEFRGSNELQIPLCPEEVEEIESMTFSPAGSLDQPPGLFTQDDGTTTTKVREESRRLFGHSATSSFFAFLPISYWKQVTEFSNSYAVANGSVSNAIELDEIVAFLGILFYMALVDKGEMYNYWRDNEEETIFPGATSTNLESVMTWNRFLHIRKNVSFRSEVTEYEVKRDPAARIRPLLTMLKTRCLRHIIVGRNVAVDEASIACRSKYARHVIVYNPRKPTGKYHFKLYMCCCSTSWLVVSFKLHCSSQLHDRLEGVVERSAIDRLAELTKKSSDVRRHVLEVTQSLNGSRRIVNTDNFYTSCLLLESLRSVGLYGRGTVRASSKHFPHFTMLDPKLDTERGSMRQGVCIEKHIVAASWMDGSIVNVVSNADDSDTSSVLRTIGQKRMDFEAPTCVREYNAAMQGVDRHDQLRGRFSIANGHSFKKWHKKLAMSMIDIARCNAYICHYMVQDELTNDSGRDKHRGFVAALIREMFDGTWKQWQARDDGLVFAGSDIATVTEEKRVDGEDGSATAAVALPRCVAKEASVVLKNRSRSMRECTVCRLEGRSPTQKTDFCETHHVSLCKRTYCVDATKPHLCQEANWTCWQKFHQFYLLQGVYSHAGNLKRGSSIYKAQAPFIKKRGETNSQNASSRNSEADCRL